jgi:hypothetical protein
MNKNKVACLLLIMLLAGIAYGTQIMQKKTAFVRGEAEIANTEYEDARTKCEMAEISLGTYTASTAELLAFLKNWEPVIDRTGSGQEAEAALLNIVRSTGVLTISQKFEVKENRGGGIIPKTFLGTLIVQDDFPKTLNFLGEIERRLPLARITSCHIKQGDTGQRINLEIRIEIPLVNLQAEVEVAKKK